MIRTALVFVTIAVMWSFVWFDENGVAFLIPGFGGYYFGGL